MEQFSAGQWRLGAVGNHWDLVTDLRIIQSKDNEDRTFKGYVSVCKVPAQACRPEFNPQNSCKTLGVAVSTCNPSMNRQTGGPWVHRPASLADQWAPNSMGNLMSENRVESNRGRPWHPPQASTAHTWAHTCSFTTHIEKMEFWSSRAFLPSSSVFSSGLPHRGWEQGPQTGSSEHPPYVLQR